MANSNSQRMLKSLHSRNTTPGDATCYNAWYTRNAVAPLCRGTMHGSRTLHRSRPAGVYMGGNPKTALSHHRTGSPT
ncbi:hypothetical protein [Fischerella sp. PCC 9605]|uniref:hypothetical protein n=1 Tax=Fischerella sp. PCC 9605 TaxID=1173024 RepID=UPI0012DED17C|nr:hypothetical protein [Fischerella sp. PCC 9605]